jgi:hypothetical protein
MVGKHLTWPLVMLLDLLASLVSSSSLSSSSFSSSSLSSSYEMSNSVRIREVFENQK